MLLNTEGGLLVVVGLEALLTLTLNALHVHLDGLLRLASMLETVGCLVIQILGIVLSILLRPKHIAKKASFQGLVSLSFQLGGLGYEIASSGLYHYYLCSTFL